MKAETTSVINIASKEEEFLRHLSKENENVLFSAPYGFGKSFFIENFFKKREDQFFVVKLNPVNYSVASNEDIFRFIIVDIIDELLCKLSKEPNTKISKSLLTKQFLSENVGDIFISLTELIPSIGKNISSFLKNSKRIFEAYEKYISDNEEVKPILDYLKGKLKKENYLLFENDFAISFINEMLNEISSAGEIKIILVIDDLDRIDPEHIFRIFNVLSAAFDKTNKDSIKLGFNHTILVCDFDNIKTIFHHRYGENVDSSGYFNKFFSVSPFFYFNLDKFIEHISTKFSNYSQNESNNIEITSNNNIIDSFQYIEINFIKSILQLIAASGQLDYRTFLKDKLIQNNFKDKKIPGNNVFFSQLALSRTAFFLNDLFGGYKSFDHKLLKVFNFYLDNLNNSGLELKEDFESFILPVVSYSIHGFSYNNKRETYNLSEKISIITFQLIKEPSNRKMFYYTRILDSSDGLINNNAKEYILQLRQALKILNKWGVIN